MQLITKQILKKKEVRLQTEFLHLAKSKIKLQQTIFSN